MKVATSARYSAPTSIWMAATAILLAVAGTTSCSSGGATPKTPLLSGNTQVTVVLTGTANDQVTEFNVQFQSLTLTTQSGKTVTLLSSQQPSEFIHLNTRIEPLTTATIPQDIYTSAVVKLGGAEFVCDAQVPGGGLGFAHYSVVNQGPTVSLTSPITITGSSMALLLNMQVSNSAVFPSCWTTPAFEGFSMTPTFNLTPYVLSTSATNSGNGKVTGLKATVAAVGTTASSSTLSVAAGPFGTRSLCASANSGASVQGISGASALSSGMFLDVDGVIQSDGSLLATRIEVENPSAVNMSTGPIMQVDALVPVLLLYGRTEMGPLLTDPVNGQTGQYDEIPYFDFSNTKFQISGQFTNLQTLPFVPSFDAASMASGQTVDVTSGPLTLGGGTYDTANTITLIPQTINGTVVASQQIGSFMDYSISLASYDLFPTLAVQQGQTTQLTNPNQMEVYVDSNTEKVNTELLAPGETFRFYGLVFNDSGTLRMDCAQVSDGVPFSEQSNASNQVTISHAETTRRETPRGMQKVTTTITRP